MKKNQKIIENFYLTSLFTLNSNSCKSVVDTIHPSIDQEINVFKVVADVNKPVTFAFDSTKGLVRINKTTGSIELENILSELISIKSYDIEAYKKFFEQNGFLFPINNNEYEEIDADNLLRLISRLNGTLKLMSQLSDLERKDYKEIVKLIFFLMYQSKIVLESKSFSYSSSEHYFLSNAIAHGADKTKAPSTDNENNYIVNDSIFGTCKFNKNDFYRIMMDKEVDDFYKKIIHNYVYDQDAPTEIRFIIEYIYQIFSKIGNVLSSSLETIEFEKEPSWEYLIESKALKDASLKMAKILIGEEINSNIKNVHPEYDIEIMEPRWKVDSLFSALYFSLFYLKPNTEIIRLCANPKCGKYFNVSRTSLKKKYCCPECANRANQNRYRARIKA